MSSEIWRLCFRIFFSLLALPKINAGEFTNFPFLRGTQHTSTTNPTSVKQKNSTEGDLTSE